MDYYRIVRQIANKRTLPSSTPAAFASNNLINKHTPSLFVSNVNDDAKDNDKDDADDNGDHCPDHQLNSSPTLSVLSGGRWAADHSFHVYNVHSSSSLRHDDTIVQLLVSLPSSRLHYRCYFRLSVLSVLSSVL